jgi:hypothetical protein
LTAHGLVPKIRPWAGSRKRLTRTLFSEADKIGKSPAQVFRP